MAPLNLPWKRLVRYSSPSDRAVKYGEPIAALDTDIVKLAQEGTLQVQQLMGTDPLHLQKTNLVEDVARLYGPLEPKDVPIIRCIGLNYKSHIIETGRPLPTCPTVFTKPGPAVADHDSPVPIPKLAQGQCDYEGELVIYIGREGKNISAENALDYVAGYTVGNDVSARDWQREAGKAGPVPQWGFSKSFDKYAPLGPCLVQQEVLNEAGGLSLRTFVNGELRQEGHTSDLAFGVRELIEFCSQGQTLQEGSLIMTGTPGGVGLFMKPPNFLKSEDEVSVEIENIGTLRNTIVFEK